MGTRNLDRMQKTWSLRSSRPNFIWIARCMNCGRKSPVPAEKMLERFGEKEILMRAAMKLKCDGCERSGADVYQGELPDPAPGQSMF
jgi:hypothetical protein